MSKADSTISKNKRRPPAFSPARRWWFRITAVLLGLSLFAVAEAACIVFDWGRPTDYPDPYVGFQEIHPLFVPDESGERYEIAKSRRKFFAAESFPAEKGESAFRIFCLGGSTVQGRPYSIPTSFTTWLELSLNAGDPRREWETVNCGGISYASYRLVPILKECLGHKPDLIILCTGHNEFLEERSYDHIKHASKFISVPTKHLSRLRTFTLLRSAVLSATGRDGKETPADRPTLGTDVNALLDYNGGTKAYHRDEAWRAGVIEHFEFNVRRMVRLARNADVPIVLVLPPSNLKNSPPFKSEHKTGLSSQRLAEWTSLTKKARSHYRGDLRKSVELFNRAIDIDDRYAVTHFELAVCYYRLWELTADRQWLDRAERSYQRTREEDICPLRMIAPMENALRRIARETGTVLLDAHNLLEQKTRDGILGDEFLVDHVHPSPYSGHRIIADALADEIRRQGFFKPTRDWDIKRKVAFEKHTKPLLKSLYSARGKQTLEALRAWASGRADGPPIESRKKASSK